jgi:hypothetical protein
VANHAITRPANLLLASIIALSAGCGFLDEDKPLRAPNVARLENGEVEAIERLGMRSLVSRSK